MDDPIVGLNLNNIKYECLVHGDLGPYTISFIIAEELSVKYGDLNSRRYCPVCWVLFITKDMQEVKER